MKRNHDLVDRVRQIKADLHEIVLSPARWRTFATPRPLNWTKISFESANRNQVPKQRGIYAFTLEVSNHNLPGHAYILYVGQAGHDSGGDLHKRYAQYLAETKRQNARKKIIYMMTMWKGDLNFNFVEIPDRRINLKKLESSLLTALIPPANTKDFDADIQDAVGARF